VEAKGELYTQRGVPPTGASPALGDGDVISCCPHSATPQRGGNVGLMWWLTTPIGQLHVAGRQADRQQMHHMQHSRPVVIGQAIDSSGPRILPKQNDLAWHQETADRIELLWCQTGLVYTQHTIVTVNEYGRSTRMGGCLAQTKKLEVAHCSHAIHLTMSRRQRTCNLPGAGRRSTLLPSVVWGGQARSTGCIKAWGGREEVAHCPESECVQVTVRCSSCCCCCC